MKQRLETNCCLTLVLVSLFITLQIPGLTGTACAISNDECYDCHGSSDILDMDASDRLDMVVPVEGKVRHVSPGITSLFVDPDRYAASVHGDMSCTACHTDINELPHRQYLEPVNCSMCHEEVTDQYEKSRHFKKSHKQCWACHNPHEELPVDKLTHEQRTAICLRCHKGTPHDWLPQPATHFKYLECTVCHSPKATKGMFLRFCALDKNGKLVPLTYAQLANAMGTDDPDLFKVIDVNHDGKLEPFEINVVINHLKDAGLDSPTFKEDILVINPYHNFTDRVKNIKDCAMCHTSVSPFYNKVQVEVPQKDGGFKKYPVDRQYLAKMPPIPNQHAYLKSVHAQNGVTCLDCHSELKVLKRGGKTEVKFPGIVVCADCHSEIVENYKKSLHYRVSKKICYNCHNPHAVEPISQMTAEQRKAICQKCHNDALKKHKWLSQAKVHFKFLECTMCHSPNAKKGIVYYFRAITADGRAIRLTYKAMAEILGKDNPDIAHYIHKGPAGQVSAYELSSFLEKLNNHIKRVNNLKYIDVGVHLIVLKPVHNFTDKGIKAKQCTVCHSANASFYSSVLLEIPQVDGGVQTLPLDRSVLTGVHGISGTSDFYLLGEHRMTARDLEELWYTVKSIGFRWIDIIGAMIVLGGFGFVGLHTLFRILTRKNRQRNIHDIHDDSDK